MRKYSIHAYLHIQEVLDSPEFAKHALIDDGNWTGQSALHKACKSGFTELVIHQYATYNYII